MVLLTVTPNPSIDRVWHVPGFKAGGSFAVEKIWLGAGGKGCNVARVAAKLGARVVATGFLAGSAGDFIEADLQRAGVRPAFYRLPAGETRTCPTIVDPGSDRVTEIREPGPPVTESATQAFEAHFLSLLDERVSVVTLSGSLSPGLPRDFYARLIRAAAGRGVPCILDASGEALRAGIKATPWAVKVNQAELAGLDGAGVPGGPVREEELVRLLTRVVEGGVTVASVTRGRDGLLAFDGKTLWRASPPAGLAVVQPVGSGDAATAALAVRLSRWRAEGRLELRAGPGFAGLPETERAGLIVDMVAAGAANAVTEGIGTFPPHIFATFRRQVTVEAVS